MRKLKAAIKKEVKTRKTEFLQTLKKLDTIEDILPKWYLKQLIPISSQHKQWESVNQLKSYLIVRKDKQLSKSLEKTLSHIDTVKNAQDIQSITINVDWKKSRMWGNNPKAEIKVILKNGLQQHFESSRASGYGYDKESTVIAEALNQCNGLLKLLYKAKNKDVTKENRNLIGYGSGYQILPELEGGVGISCMNKICESLKLKFINLSSGKTFDIYQLTKI